MPVPCFRQISSVLFVHIALLSWLTTVRGQDFCQISLALARQTLQQSSVCTSDFSSCTNNEICGECYDAEVSGATSCDDGCAFSTPEGYTVQRRFSAVYGSEDLIDVIATSIVIGIHHTFTAGAQGTYDYSFIATILDDGTTAPQFGGTCTFTFNGEACVCEQIWCDANEESYGNRIDCSALEGGAVIDLCNAIPARVEPPLSLLEILFAVPFVVCDGKNFEAYTVPAASPSADTSTSPPASTNTDTTTSPPAEPTETNDSNGETESTPDEPASSPETEEMDEAPPASVPGTDRASDPAPSPLLTDNMSPNDAPGSAKSGSLALVLPPTVGYVLVLSLAAIVNAF